MLSPKSFYATAVIALALCLTGCAGLSTSGSSSQTTQSGGFSIAVAPTSATVNLGGNATLTTSVAVQGGFNAPVTLSLSGLPTGVSGTFSSSTITGAGNPTLRITASSSATAGNYTVNVNGSSGSIISTSSFSLAVSSSTSTTADFSISASPNSQTVTAGNSTSFTVNISAINSFTGTVGLVESGMPSGMLAGCSPSSITSAGSCTLNVSTTSSTPAGTYTLSITGTSGSLVHSTSVSVTVNAVTLNPDFSFSASPSSQTVAAGKSTAFTATVGALNGFSGSVTLGATGLPSGVTASFAPSSITTSGNSTLTLTTSKSAVAGTYTVTISGKSGSLAHNTSASLVVTTSGAALNVLQTPGVTSTTWYTNDFPTYLFSNPVVNGATIAVEWGGSDQGPSAGSGQYDWSYPDGQAQAWIQAGKRVNFVVWANADNASTTCGSEAQYGSNGTGNCAIPAYVWTALGSSNYVTCSTQYGNQQLPNYFASAFQTNYRAFIAAMIQHYKGNASVGYIRFGLGHGGESLPVANWNDTTTACGQAFVNSWGLTIQTWETYLSTMLNYEGSLNSPVQLMTGVTPMGNPNTQIPDYAAPIAVQNGIGFGSQGLELSDVNNCAGSTADWCDLFATYTGQVPLELQTYLQSCPDNSCTTGSLVNLVPWAVTNHATILEIYWQDWLVAYDPNYPGYYPQYQPVLAAAAQ